MDLLSVNDLLRKSSNPEDEGRFGTAGRGNIDKTGFFYHVVTKSFDGSTVFYRDIADYRHRLLCKLCESNGITIIFSVTMLNHTHDVFLTPDWTLLAKVFRNLNMNVTKQFRKRYKRKLNSDLRVLRRYPIYVVIRDIKTLFYEGKYIFDNPLYLEKQGKGAPHSCFWMFSGNHFVAAYDESIYKRLFNLTPAEIHELYSTHSKAQILEYADTHFRNWSDEANRRVFYK